MSQDIQEPQRAITSPSNLFRRKLCPGSARLEAKVPKEHDPETEWATEGKLLHEYFAKGSTEGLADKTLVEVLDAAFALKSEMLNLFLRDASIPATAEYEESAERRLILRRGPQVIFPGTTDYLRHYLEPGTLMIIDAKFGRQEVTSADNNLQLAAYAVMAVDEMPAETIYAAIVQPRAPYGHRTTSAMYEASQVDGMRESILAIEAATHEPDAPLNPSPDACRNCRAKTICPAYRGEIVRVGSLPVEDMETLLALPAEEFGRIGDAIKLAAMLKDPWSDEARRRIEADELPGWKLKETGATSSLQDSKQAYIRFAEKYADFYANQGELAADFLGCFNPAWGKLEKLVGKLEKCGDKKARRVLNEIFEGLIQREEKQKSPVRA